MAAEDKVTTGSRAPKLLRSMGTVAGATLVSRLLGFIRDIVLAQVFGATGSLDAFLIAFKIPNFLRRMFAEGAFAQAFVPVLTGAHAKGDARQTTEFINKVAGNLACVLLLLVIVAEIISPLLISLFAPGYHNDPTRHQLATHMLRITFPYIFLIALTAMAGAIMNSLHRFALPAFTPILLNLAFIAAALFWAPHVAQPIYVLAWAVMIGGVCQLAIQLPALARLGYLPRPQLDWRHSGVRLVLRKMLPICFGASVAQLGLLLDNVFASFLPAGSISWLYYADRFTYLPLGVIGVALSTVVLPSLSRQHAEKSDARFQKTLAWALRWVWVIGLPAAVALFLLSGPILATCLYRGAFSVNDLTKTAAALHVFALGLPAFMLIKILSSAFYARGQVKKPVKIAVFALGVNVVFNFLLIHSLRHVGLALATAIAAWCNAILLAIMLRGELKKIAATRVFLNWFLCSRVLLVNLLMVAGLWYFVPAISVWLHWSFGRRILVLVAIVAAVKILYTTLLLLLGVRWRMLREP